MNDNTCGAKTRAGTPCKHPAGWGTDHVGEGRCKLHGGASLREVDSGTFKHGGRPRETADRHTLPVSRPGGATA